MLSSYGPTRYVSFYKILDKILDKLLDKMLDKVRVVILGVQAMSLIRVNGGGSLCFARAMMLTGFNHMCQ